MKKILLLYNDYTVATNTLAIALHIANKSSAALHALFIASLQAVNDTDRETSNTESNEATKFEGICSKNNVAYAVHQIKNKFLDSIVDQSIFADLIICDENADETKFSLNSLMINAHCPVLSIPKEALPFTEIILTFDESAASMNSIKHFTYLFSPWLNLPAYLVSVLPGNVIDLEYRKPLTDWLYLYFKNISIEILKGKEDSLYLRKTFTHTCCS